MTGQIIAMIKLIKDNNVLITQESNLRYDIGLTSLEMMLLFSQIESKYGIIFTAEQWTCIQTVADLVSSVDEKL